MNALGLIEGMSLVEGLIYGFIAVNMFLSGAYLVQRGVARLAEARSK